MQVAQLEPSAKLVFPIDFPAHSGITFGAKDKQGILPNTKAGVA
jgi:hypothetical protein